MKQISKNVVVLTGIRLLWSITFLFIDTFMSVYFIQTSKSTLGTLIGYRLVFVTTICIFFVLFGKVGKSDKRLTLIRISLIFCMIFFLTLLLLKEKSCDYWWLIGIMLGISCGLYHTSYNALETDCLDGVTRGKFLGVYNSISNTVKLVLPVIFGIIIDKFGFSINFITMLIITLVHAILLFILIDPKAGTERTKYSLVKFYREIKSKTWYKQYAIMMLSSGFTLSTGALNLLASIIILEIVTSSTVIGITQSISYIIAIVCGVLFCKVLSNKKIITSSCWISTIAFSIAILGITFGFNELFVVIYYITMSLYKGSTVISRETIELNIGASKFIKDQRQEYYVIGDVLLAIGRILGHSILLIYVITDIKAIMIMYIIVLIVMMIYIMKLQRFIEKEEV